MSEICDLYNNTNMYGKISWLNYKQIKQTNINHIKHI